MDCEQAVALISAQLDQEIQPSERSQLDLHLRECGACRATADAFALQHQELHGAFEPRRRAAAAVADRVNARIPAARAGFKTARPATLVRPSGGRGGRRRRLCGGAAAGAMVAQASTAYRRVEYTQAPANRPAIFADGRTDAPTAPRAEARREARRRRLHRNQGGAETPVHPAGRLHPLRQPEHQGATGGRTNGDADGRDGLRRGRTPRPRFGRIDVRRPHAGGPGQGVRHQVRGSGR